MMFVQDNLLPAPSLGSQMPDLRTPGDLADPRVGSLESAPHGLAHRITDLLKRLLVARPAARFVCPPAWELTGITRIDRYDIALWLSS